MVLGGCTKAIAATAPAPHWELTWSDEFNGANGSSPDPTKWTFASGGSGWGNHELESYTSRPVNVQQKNGDLVITAQKENYTGSDGVARHYTSGRILTQGLFSQAYGRFEARIQLPLGKGIWPAFWMLGNNIGKVGGPTAGEIDVMENIGNPMKIYSTLHGPQGSMESGQYYTAAPQVKYMLPAGEAVNTGFHIYAVEWKPNDVKFFVDDKMAGEFTRADMPAGAIWVFDHPFFILLNVAVGGNWPGAPDATTIFPQRMLVDYVRVYKAARSK